MSSKPPESVAEIFEEHYPPGTPSRELLWEHSAAVATLSLEIGRTHQARLDFLEEAAWLHDIGIRYTHAPGILCQGDPPYLCHGILGREICEKAGLPEHGMVCETHVGTGLTADEVKATGYPMPHRDMLPKTLEERIICYADQFFSKSTPNRLPVDDVRRRVARHGEASLARFEALHLEFGTEQLGEGLKVFLQVEESR